MGESPPWCASGGGVSVRAGSAGPGGGIVPRIGVPPLRLKTPGRSRSRRPAHSPHRGVPWKEGLLWGMAGGGDRAFRGSASLRSRFARRAFAPPPIPFASWRRCFAREISAPSRARRSFSAVVKERLRGHCRGAVLLLPLVISYHEMRYYDVIIGYFVMIQPFYAGRVGLVARCVWLQSI